MAPLLSLSQPFSLRLHGFTFLRLLCVAGGRGQPTPPWRLCVGAPGASWLHQTPRGTLSTLTYSRVLTWKYLYTMFCSTLFSDNVYRGLSWTDTFYASDGGIITYTQSCLQHYVMQSRPQCEPENDPEPKAIERLCIWLVALVSSFHGDFVFHCDFPCDFRRHSESWISWKKISYILAVHLCCVLCSSHALPFLAGIDKKPYYN